MAVAGRSAAVEDQVERAHIPALSQTADMMISCASLRSTMLFPHRPARWKTSSLTLYEGRPRGMPAWRGKIPDEQMWQLAAYVKSLNQPGGIAPPL